MRIRVFSVLSLILFLISCDNGRFSEIKNAPIIDFTNSSVLDSLIRKTSFSNDTIFLGFRIGMSKKDYQTQIKTLIEDGLIISYSNSNVFSTIVGQFDVGPGYTFKTDISIEKAGKNFTGKGEYFLEPHFNNDDKLYQLNVLPLEIWVNKSDTESPNWLEKNVFNNSIAIKDANLKKTLIDYKVLDTDYFIRQKGNVIIYKTSVTVNYIDLKTLLINLNNVINKKELIQKSTNKIKF